MPLFIVPKGSLSAQDKRRIRSAGHCVVELDDPSKAVTVLPCAPILGDDLLRAATLAIRESGYDSVRCLFASKVIALLNPPTP